MKVIKLCSISANWMLSIQYGGATLSIGRVASPLEGDCVRHQRQNLSFHILHARQSATVRSAWLQLGRGIPWHRPCSPLSHLQFFDVAWRLNCSRAPSQINCFSERSVLHDSVYFTTLKSLDYNVVMTFRFNNNNNNNNWRDAFNFQLTDKLPVNGTYTQK